MHIAANRKLSMSLLAYQIGHFIISGITLTNWGAVKNSIRRKPGVLLVILGIVGDLRPLLVHRSRLYITIETSGLFVFLATFVLAAILHLAARKSRRQGDKEEKSHIPG